MTRSIRVGLLAGFALRCVLLAFALAASAAVSAQSQTVWVLVDQDHNPATGCSVTLAGQAMPGMETRIEVMLATGTPLPTVGAITQSTCAGGSFGAATAFGANGAFGLGSGAAGLDVLELGMPQEALASVPSNNATLGIATSGSAGADALYQLEGGFGGTPMPGFSEPITIPSAGIVSLLLLGALLVALGLRKASNLRRWGALSLYGLLAISGVALAANFLVDGQIGDWAGEPNFATSPTNGGADLRGVWIARENGRAFVRIDVANLREAAPAFTSAATAAFTVGTAGSFTVTASGLPAPTLSMSNGTLPAGMTFDAATGVLSGTPATATGGNRSLQFTASNSRGTQNQSFTLSVREAPAITSAAAATFRVGQLGNFAVTSNGFPAARYDVGGALPAGVSFAATTGVLSGTPNAGSAGSYALSFTATNTAGSSAPQNFVLTVNDGPSFSSAATTTFVTGQNGSFTVAASGTPAPTIALTGGDLPAGVSFAGGVLSGLPESNAAGVHALEFTATNSAGSSTQAFTLNVHQRPSITSDDSATLQVGQAGSFIVTASGFPAASFTLGGTLPAGVAFDGATGALSGTPQAGAAGSYDLVFTASNAAGNSPPQNFVLTVNDGPVFTSAATAIALVGDNFDFEVTASGTPAPTLAQTGGTLPAGLSFANGHLTGTPASGTGGARMLQFTATNTAGSSTQSFALEVHQKPAITSDAAVTFPIGQAGSFGFTASGYPAPTFSLSGALPVGVSFANGVLAGTPQAGSAGEWIVVITAGNDAGDSAPQSFTLTVSDPPVITSAASTIFRVGSFDSFTLAASGTPTPALTLSAGTLPAGVSFANGVLSGVAEAGTGARHVLEFQASSSAGTSTQNFELFVHEAPKISSQPNTTFAAGAAGSFSFTSTGYPVPAFALTGALPDGVVFDAGTATLSGTPAADEGGDYALQVTATNAAGSSSQNFSLRIEQTVAFTSAATATFQVGDAGSFALSASGFPAPGISLLSGTLPNGVTFNDATDTLSGTPADGAGGTRALQFSADNGIDSATQAFTLVVEETPEITSAASATLRVGTPGSIAFTADGYPAASFSVGGAALPAGLALGADNASIIGTPAPGTGGVYNLQVTPSNVAGSGAMQAFTLTIEEAPAFGGSGSATFRVGQAGNHAFAVTGYPAPTLALSSGALPAGVAVNAGNLSGTPANGSGGSYSPGFTATNSVSSASYALALSVEELPAISSAASAVASPNVAFSFTVTSQGYPATSSYVRGGDALPASLAFDASTGVLSGTPGAADAGQYDLTFAAVNPAGTGPAQNFTLTVSSQVITSAAVHTCLDDDNCSFTFTASGTPTSFALAGGVPGGLTFTPATGVLSGDLDINQHGLHPLTVTANYAGGGVATQAFTLRIGPFITAVSPATIVAGTAATVTGFGFSATPANNGVRVDGATAAIDPATTTAESITFTVPCVANGTQPVIARNGTKSSPSFPHPATGAGSLTLAAGESATISGTTAQSRCAQLLPSGDSNAEYIIAVYSNSTSPTSNAPYSFSGDSAGGDEGPLARPLPPQPDALQRPALTLEQIQQREADDAHARLLAANASEYERLRDEFGDQSKRAPAGGAKAVPPLTRTFRVSNINATAPNTVCGSYYVVAATRVYYNGKIAIYEDDATPVAFKAASSATMASNYQRIGDQFNADMEPIIRNNFGDVLRRDAQTDNNGALVALFTPRINNSFSGVAGYVVTCDQFPNDDANTPAVGGPYTGSAGSTNGASNFGEFFYAYQPVTDAAGYSGNTPENWYRTIRSTFIHETKHVASNAARVDNNAATYESAWLEEGTARHAEELWMRNAVDNVAWKANTGYGSLANPINIYCDSRPGFAECDANARRPASIMQRHFSSLYTNMFGTNARLLSPFGATASDNASYWYATSWSLVRYTLDRYGSSDAAFFTALNNATTSGITNLLARAGGVSIDQILSGWALSFAVDDRPASTLDASTQQPTWNFRSIYGGFNTDFPSTYTLAYPAVPTELSFGNFTAPAVTTLRGGGVLWYRLSGTHTEAQALRLTDNAGAAPSANLRIAVTRTR